MTDRFNSPIELVIEKRKSVRTYLEEPLTGEDLEGILSYMRDLSNPFGKKVKFSFLETEGNRKALGTYGIIKGTVNYIGAAVKEEPLALEAVGYEMEKLILYCADKNIGTCWLGGTFKREDFRQAMEVEAGYLFPVITPVGYPKENKSLADNLVRFIAKGDMRKPWNELFFMNSFNEPVDGKNANKYERILEMVRLAPSASNKQPWRILLKEGVWHFFEAKTPGYSDAFSYDIQKIDLGIAACHFEMAAREKGISGKIAVLDQPDIVCPENIHYAFSWVEF